MGFGNTIVGDLNDQVKQLQAELVEKQELIDLLYSEEPCPKCGYGVTGQCYGCVIKRLKLELASEAAVHRNTIANYEQLQAENKDLKRNLQKYGRHLKSCELVKQPFLGSTERHWRCNCDFSKALNCGVCNQEGYVIELKIRGGYLTGHCPNCGKI